MKKVTVFGGSGKVGSGLVKKLLEDGWDVVAFVHQANPFSSLDGLTVVRGDVHNLTDVSNAIKGSDIVISALGSWGTKQKDIVSGGMKNIIQAMSESGIKRVVSLTGSDAFADGQETYLGSRIMHTMLSLTPARKIIKDGELHLRLLQQSQLDWTVLRSPIMNDSGDPKGYTLTDIKPHPWQTVNRQSVALAMVELIDNKRYYKKSPFIKRK